MSEINKKFITALEEAGFREWTTMTEWRDNHSSSYRVFYLAGHHKKLADEMGWDYVDSSKKKQEIKEFFKKNKRFPPSSSKNPQEKKLYQALSSYCSKSKNVYDQEFDIWARSNGYGSYTSSLKKQEIKDFFKKNKSFPSQSSKNPEEKKLGQALMNYCSQSNGSYDQEFDIWTRSKGYGADTSLKKDKIKEFFKKNKDLPSESSKNPEEKKLGQALRSYCSQSGNSYDQEFDEWARSNGYGKRKNKEELR